MAALKPTSRSMRCCVCERQREGTRYVLNCDSCFRPACWKHAKDLVYDGGNAIELTVVSLESHFALRCSPANARYYCDVCRPKRAKTVSPPVYKEEQK